MLGGLVCLLWAPLFMMGALGPDETLPELRIEIRSIDGARARNIRHRWSASRITAESAPRIWLRMAFCGSATSPTANTG